MATDDPHDADDYFEALAGRQPGSPGAQALRHALQAQAQTLREAEHANAQDLSALEQARMDALKQRLLAAGAFRPAPAPAVRPGWTERLRALLVGDAWQRPVAIAAGVLMASVLALRLGAPDRGDDGSDRLRGAGSAVIKVSDPAAVSAALEAQLSAAGAEVVLVQTAATEWRMRITVPDATRLPQVRQLLREAGFDTQGLPPFELGVMGRP